MIVDDHGIVDLVAVVIGSIPVTKRTPTNVRVISGPGYPGRRIIPARHPVPTEADIPAPAAVVVRHITKGIVRDPSQAT